MKPPFFYKRCRTKVILSLVFAISMCTSSFAQSSEEKSYVVVGAFSMQSNANRFTDILKDQGLDVTKKLNSQRNLYYVYAYEFESRKDALDKVKEVKGDYPDLYDAWIYTGNFSNVYASAAAKQEAEEVIAETSESQVVEEEEEQSDVETTTDEQEVVEEEVEEVASPPVVQNPVRKPQLEKEVGHYYVYVNTINARNAKEVKGKIEVIDPVRAKRLSLEEAHEIIDIEDPNNGSTTIKLAPSIFGFKPSSHVIDLTNPVNDSTGNYVEQIGDSIIVNFELERLRKGEIVVLFNVYFYKDAAIMKEESVYELNQLRNMMLENKGMKIRIHGHTNGNSFGKVLHLDENDKDFFNLKGEEHKEAAGSAKKLSLYRAVTIKRWLMDQGVDDSRMETKGWGGKRMLAGKHDSQAHKNVRVEIEVLQDE